MADDKIGYGNPPKATRFKAGTSGNPKGRPKRDQSVGNIVKDVFDEIIEYDDNGRKRTATRREVVIKSLIRRAIQGDVGAAEILFRMRASALRRSDSGFKQLLVRDPLPDYPGQTAAQKARELGLAMDIQVIVVEDGSSAFGQPAEEDGSSESSVTGAVDESAD